MSTPLVGVVCPGPGGRGRPCASFLFTALQAFSLGGFLDSSLRDPPQVLFPPLFLIVVQAHLSPFLPRHCPRPHVGLPSLSWTAGFVGLPLAPKLSSIQSQSRRRFASAAAVFLNVFARVVPWFSAFMIKVNFVTVEF